MTQERLSREDEAWLLAVLEWFPLEPEPNQELFDRAEVLARLPEQDYQRTKARLIAQKRQEAVRN